MVHPSSLATVNSIRLCQRYQLERCVTVHALGKHGSEIVNVREYHNGHDTMSSLETSSQVRDCLAAIMHETLYTAADGSSNKQVLVSIQAAPPCKTSTVKCEQKKSTVHARSCTRKGRSVRGVRCYCDACTGRNSLLWLNFQLWLWLLSFWDLKDGTFVSKHA